MKKRVGIVGAGVSGLAACKSVKEKGFHPIVFEAGPSPGGLWTRTFASTKLQTPKISYRFSDFPWPDDVTEEFPAHDKVVDYLQSYAEHFELLPYIRFNSKVLGVEYAGVSEEEMNSWGLWSGTGEAFAAGKWQISVACESAIPEVHEVDFLILCIGRFSDVPNIPIFPPNHGPEVFKGKVMHSMDYANMNDDDAAELVKGKRVTIIGFQKSALDLAAECATVNGTKYPCTMVGRTSRWLLPHYSPWGISMAFFYLNRLSEVLVHKPGQGLILSLLATLLTPMRWIISNFVASYYKWKLPLRKYNMVPDHHFYEEVSTCSIGLLPENFYDRVEEGSIALRKSKTFRFHEEGVIVDNEAEVIKSDLVIFATGYKGAQKLRNIFLDEKIRNKLMGLSSIIPLYRDCVHPRIPQLAIIGFTESLSNMFTLELQAKWLVCFLDGRFPLPSIVSMEKDAYDWQAHMRKKSCNGSFHIWYSDLLCKDIGCEPKRKKVFLADWLLPYIPIDYAHLDH